MAGHAPRASQVGAGRPGGTCGLGVSPGLPGPSPCSALAKRLPSKAWREAWMQVLTPPSPGSETQLRASWSPHPDLCFLPELCPLGSASTPVGSLQHEGLAPRSCALPALPRPSAPLL